MDAKNSRIRRRLVVEFVITGPSDQSDPTFTSDIATVIDEALDEAFGAAVNVTDFSGDEGVYVRDEDDD